MSPIKAIVVSLITIATLHSCKKKDDIKFVITVNDTPHRLREIGISATYYPQIQFLFIRTSEEMFLNIGVYVNTPSPINSYVFEPNGSNATSIQLADGAFMTDDNVADAGGSFTLTAFDTVQKKLSCNFKATCYSGDRIGKKTVSSTLENLSFKTDTVKYSGNSMSCTVNGVKTTNWQSKIGAFSSCFSREIYFKFTSTSVPRALHFNIPFSLGTGTYPVKAGGFSCGSGQLLSLYQTDSVYNPTSGSINITRMDVAHKKMEASFNLDLKDSKGDRIQITNGSFILNAWDDLP